MSCPTSQQLLRLADDDLSPDAQREVQQHVDGCAKCQTQLASWRSTIQGVQTVAPDAQSVQRQARVMRAIARTEARPRPESTRMPWLWRWGVGFAAAAAAAVLVVVLRAPDADETAPQARGGDEMAAQWAGIALFKLAAPGARPQPLRKTLATTDRLLISYSNQAPARFAWLTVIARDAAGSVHWLHPARPAQGSDGAGLQLAANVVGKEIPQALQIPAAPGPMHIWALFTAQPLTRAQIESWLASADAAIKPVVDLPWPDSHGQHMVVQIVTRESTP